MTSTSFDPDAYWVQPGALMAGIHPNANYVTDTRRILRGLLGLGVTSFIDLTEEGELDSYVGLLQDEAGKLSIEATHTRFAIKDMNTPDVAQMAEIIETIRFHVYEGGAVYVHCFAGVGRTGTVVGCYLIDDGVPRETVFDEIARLRGRPNAPQESPVTDAQRRMVLGWQLS